MVHVKGLRKMPPVTGEAVAIDKILPDITEVGHDDVIDWKRIFAQAKTAGIKHYFVEHDVPKQPFESLKASHDYIEKLAFRRPMRRQLSLEAVSRRFRSSPCFSTKSTPSTVMVRRD